MPIANQEEDGLDGERGALRHALVVERVRAWHCRAVLAQTPDGRLQQRCRLQLNASVARAAKLALALVDMGEAVPLAAVRTEFDARLLDAMDRVLRKSVLRKSVVPR